jgi:N-formylglutamate amidohydrolase
LFEQPDPCFRIERPAINRVPFVFNSPHSGSVYFKEFLAASQLDAKALRRSEDFLVDELFEGVVALGAPLLAAEFPRAWLDVNREPYELDPCMFDGPLPAFANTKSARVNGGLGTIARIVSENEEIYQRKLNIAEGLHRIDAYYKPYHSALRVLLAKAVVQFGYGVLIDCHSMPSSHGNAPVHSVRSRADFVLGDRHGTSCAPIIIHSASEFLRDLGYRVAINKPYAGGFITEHYGRPHNGLHALQVEINRALYMDEVELVKNAGFERLKADLSVFSARLMAVPDDGLEATISLAAE